MKEGNYDTDWSSDDSQFLRHMLPRMTRRVLGEQRGHDWLVAELGKLDTTLESASYIDLLTVEDELHTYRELLGGIPAQPSDSITVEPTAEPDRLFPIGNELVEPPAEPQPAVEDRNVLKEIAEEKITPEDVQHLETLAGQYRLGPVEFAAMAHTYGADSLDQLKKIDYRRLVSDVLRSSGRKKAPRR